MVKRNEYKRRQAPPGIRISGRAFGRDWRYPINLEIPPSRTSRLRLVAGHRVVGEILLQYPPGIVGEIDHAESS